MALRDYYFERATEDPASFVGSEGWAIKYIDISRAQSILEAFDNDASGFVTVNEVNNFTRLRPRGWRYAPFLQLRETRPFIYNVASLAG